MKEFITPKELAIKLYRQKPIWTKMPKIHIAGNKNSIGTIIFSFPEDCVEIGVYLYDKSIIKEIANVAIANFATYISDWNTERLGW